MKKLLSLFLALAAPCFALDIENDLDASQKIRVRNGIGLRIGAGVPDNGDGANGDYYVDEATAIIYKKTAGAWAATSSSNAATWYAVTATPANGFGANGDYALLYTGGEVTGLLAKSGGTWSSLATVASTATDVGLGNVDNTSDANKPVSTATQAALDTKRTYDSADFNLILEGDSIFQGVTAGGATAGNYLQDRLPLKSFFSGRATIVDVATDGDTISSVVSNYASQVYPYRPSNQSGKRAILCLLIGTNDSTTDATIATNVTTLLSYVSTAKTDGFEVWVCTLLPRNTGGTPNQWDGFNRRLRSSNIPDKIIDLNAAFRDAADTALFGDNLHPTNLGYDILADLINAAAWSDDKASRGNFGSMAKQNAGTVAITGGTASVSTATVTGGNNSLTVNGANTVSAVLDPNGTTTNTIYADAAGGFYGWDHYDGTTWRQPMRFTQGSSMAVAFGGNVTAAGDILASTAGKGLRLKSGSNQRAGNATLVAGTVTVNNTTVTANTLVHLTRKTAGGTIGNATYTLSAGNSFTITSDSASDTSVFTYILTELD